MPAKKEVETLGEIIVCTVMFQKALWFCSVGNIIGFDHQRCFVLQTKQSDE